MFDVEFLVYEIVDATRIRQDLWGEEIQFDSISEA